MKRYVTYLIAYSIGGYILERIINVIFLGYWLDNSVMIGPYQPLYGNGIVLTIAFVELFFYKQHKSFSNQLTILFASIIFTAISEASTGYFYQYFTGIHLWNYGIFFPCKLEYICFIPTSLFGVANYFLVQFIHPKIKRFLDDIPKIFFYPIIFIFLLDMCYTLISILL